MTSISPRNHGGRKRGRPAKQGEPLYIAKLAPDCSQFLRRRAKRTTLVNALESILREVMRARGLKRIQS